jgi:GNAT superfamily N-acetyltransferase
MRNARDSLGENAGWFLISDEQRVMRKLTSPGFTYVVVDSNDCVVAYLLANWVSDVDEAEGLGFSDAGNDDDGVLKIDSVAVVPAWRGHGLQRTLLQMGEADALAVGIRRCCNGGTL